MRRKAWLPEAPLESLRSIRLGCTLRIYSLASAAIRMISTPPLIQYIIYSLICNYEYWHPWKSQEYNAIFHACGYTYLSFIDPERGWFGVIFPEVMIFSEGLCPEENIITEGNIAESPERRVYKWYIIPKVKELTKFRINFKTCWINYATTIFNFFICIPEFLTFPL
jgi:hypothetical protein